MIFNRKEYIEANSIPNVCFFEWTEKNHTKISCAFSLHSDSLISLPKSPYAGIYSVTQIETEHLIDELVLFGKKHRVNSILLKQPPEPFNALHAELHKSLINRNCLVESEINHHIDLTGWQQRVSSMQMRRIRKCQKLNLLYQEQQGNEINVTEIYQFLEMCRAQQDLTLNIGFEQFSTVLSLLPKIYRVITVRQPNKELMACLVALRVDENKIYSYLPAFDRKYSELSPLAYLFYEFFVQAEVEKFQWIDLGISSIQSKPQKGLIKFKEGLGGHKTCRNTYKFQL